MTERPNNMLVVPEVWPAKPRILNLTFYRKGFLRIPGWSDVPGGHSIPPSVLPVGALPARLSHPQGPLALWGQRWTRGPSQDDHSRLNVDMHCEGGVSWAFTSAGPGESRGH